MARKEIKQLGTVK